MGEPSLLYAMVIEGKIAFYRGRPPVMRIPDALTDDWPRVPPLVRAFYQTVHNGWTFIYDDSTGPLPLADWGVLSDRIEDTDCEVAALNFDARRIRTVFHNGAGDCLCLDFDHLDAQGCASGAIWWHEKPNEIKRVDFDATLNAWTQVTLAEADEIDR